MCLETNYDANKAVNEVIFITSRVPKKTEAQLIAGCADGSLMFWCVHEAIMYAKCQVTTDNSGVGAIAISGDDNTLYVADLRGMTKLN